MTPVKPGPVGQPVPHESAPLHVTGYAVYTDDLSVRHPNLLHAWPVQVPHAHARVDRVDVTGALGVPGVVHVLTAEDVPGRNDAGVHGDEPLFPTEVMYHGHAVAWVLAECEDAAREGAARVRVDVTALDAVLTVQDAIAQESFLGKPLELTRGDALAALAEAEERLAGSLTIGGQEHFYLETHASLAHLDESGEMVVHASTQHPAETQEVVAQVLGLPRNRVTVQCLRMGGGFGGKEVQANPFASVAALGALHTGRPVRVRLNRVQDVTLTGKRHPFHGEYDVGFTRDGKLRALDLKLFSDAGWCLDLSLPVLARAMFHSDNAYLIPHMRVTGRMCKTNKTSQTAFRGFGGPQGMVMIEEIIDRVARHLNLPPDVVRERNFYRDGDATHYGQVVKDAGRLQRVWDSLRASSDYAVRQAEIAAFNARSPHAKRGLAMTPVKFGISFTFTPFNQAGALVIVFQDGSVQVNHGGTEMGQGLHTKIRQVAAHTLGVPQDVVRVMPTRTDKVPNSSATAASSGTDLNGAAVKNACDTIKQRLAAVAAQRFGIHPDEVQFHDGHVYPLAGEDQAVMFTEIVRAAYQQRVQLFSDGFYRTPNLHYDATTMKGKPFHYYSYGAAACEVEVDGFTGTYHWRRVDILHDVGDSLSPLIDLGQVEGGFIQGLGWLTLEELRWDAEGRVATRNASTYKLPSFAELPDVFNVTLLDVATESGVVYGSKAVGEPPLMLAIAGREALRAAVAAFGQGGPVELASPATPEAVFWAIEKQRARKEVAAD